MEPNDTETPHSCYYLDKSQSVMIAKVIGYILITVLSAFGNIFIIVLVIRTKRPRGAMDIFIVNMAFSDLSVPFVVGPQSLYEVITGTVGLWQVRGQLGNILCKLSTFIVDISPIVSTLTLCCITIERFLAVVRPQMSLQSLQKQERSHYIMSALTWVIAMGYCAPYFKLFRLTEYDEKRADCRYVYEDETMHRLYSLITCILFIVLPFLLMAIMYACTFIALRRSYKKMTHALSQRAQQKRTVRLWSVLKLSIAVVVGFALCWGPYNVGVFLLTFSWGWNSTDTCSFKTYWFFASFLSISNAAINPWIYLLFVERFKTNLKKTLSKSITLLNVRNTRYFNSTSVQES